MKEKEREYLKKSVGHCSCVALRMVQRWTNERYVNNLFHIYLL